MNELIVLEIPHTSPPITWVADNKNDYIDKVYDNYDLDEFEFVSEDIDNPTFEECIEVVSKDNNSCEVMTVEEAVKAYQTDGESINLVDHRKSISLAKIGETLQRLGIEYKSEAQYEEDLQEIVNDCTLYIEEFAAHNILDELQGYDLTEDNVDEHIENEIRHYIENELSIGDIEGVSEETVQSKVFEKLEDKINDFVNSVNKDDLDIEEPIREVRQSNRSRRRP